MSDSPRTEAISLPIELAERGWIPDRLLRAGIRRLIRERLRDERARAGSDPSRGEAEFASNMARGPIVIHADDANQQHYEVPPEFFRTVLGPRLKYSCAEFPTPDASLEQAEVHALARVCERAGIADGMRVLELGCGWGSLSLFVAERFPNARIVAVSNSKAQREYILAECARRGLDRLEVITANVADFEPEGRFHRVVSVEMFEHVRNWDALLARVERWLEPEGRLFVHVFCHRELAYAYETRSQSDWMARNFFSGGIMPSAGLIRRFARSLRVEQEWRIDGTHYARTSEAWLGNLDRERDSVLRALAAGRDRRDAARALQRWRIFFLAVAELFGASGGREWGVAQYRLARVDSGSDR